MSGTKQRHTCAIDAITAHGQARVVGEPVAWAATSEDGKVEALGFNQSKRFDTPLVFASPPAPQEAQADEQAVFEAWLARERPSGDADQVGRQWLASGDYEDFHAAPVAQPATEQAEAPSDSTLKLAEMILSDCGHSTAISTRLRDRVAERIERHLAIQPTASNAGERS